MSGNLQNQQIVADSNEEQSGILSPDEEDREKLLIMQIHQCSVILQHLLHILKMMVPYH